MKVAMLNKAALAAAVLCAFASQAQAAGFQLSEQSALALGRAYAGAGLDNQDLSGLFYNPAAMSLGHGTRVQAGAIVANLDLQYRGENGSRENGRGKPGVVPSLYVAHEINDKFQVGFAVTAPFGLATQYAPGWDQGFKGTRSDLKVVDFNPSVTFKLNEKWSFGAGVSFQHADAKLSYDLLGIVKNKAETIKIQDEALNRLAHSENPVYQALAAKGKAEMDEKLKPLAPLKALAGTDDELAKYKAALAANPELHVNVKDWAYGWNVGVMFKPADNIRLGLSYRSAVKHTAKGEAESAALRAIASNDEVKHLLQGLAAQNPALAGYAGGIMAGSIPASISMSAPAWAMFSGSWDINPTFTVNGMVRWTHWSLFKKLALKSPVLSGLGIGEFANKTEWKDTWFGSVGLDARVHPMVTLHTGIGYETSVIKYPEYRTGVIPDANRLWLSAGATFKPIKNLTADFGISYLKGIGERDLYKETANPKTAQPTFEKVGTFKKLNAILVGAQVQYQF